MRFDLFEHIFHISVRLLLPLLVANYSCVFQLCPTRV